MGQQGATSRLPGEGSEVCVVRGEAVNCRQELRQGALGQGWCDALELQALTQARVGRAWSCSGWGERKGEVGAEPEECQ